MVAIRHFRYLLEGCNFVVFTDQKPLVGALHRRSDPISTCQQRHLSFIAEFAPIIRHITGKSNITHIQNIYSGFFHDYNTVC